MSTRKVFSGQVHTHTYTSICAFTLRLDVFLNEYTFWPTMNKWKRHEKIHNIRDIHDITKLPQFRRIKVIFQDYYIILKKLEVLVGEVKITAWPKQVALFVFCAEQKNLFVLFLCSEFWCWEMPWDSNFVVLAKPKDSGNPQNRRHLLTKVWRHKLKSIFYFFDFSC